MRQRGFLFFVLCVAGAALGQEAQKPAPQEPPNPVLNVRPPEAKTPLQPVIEVAGKIQLDVVVTDATGKPVTDLEPWNFTVMDNGGKQKILTFRAFDGAVKPELPVEVILVMDMVNLPFQQVAFVRDQVEEFLRENGGKLRQPTSLMVLTEAGLRVEPRPSLDGNALAGVVHGIQGNIRTLNEAMGGYGAVERFQRSVKQMENIAENEARKPGRKLLIWIGPGWPLLNRSDNGMMLARDQRGYFDGIVELTNRLREAHMAVYSVSPSSATTGYNLTYQAFLKPVLRVQDADSGNLGLRVLAVQSGGLVLGPDNGVVAQIDRCVADAESFYRISVNPPAAEHADEYHELKVVVDRPGVTVRTNLGYYNEPQGP